METFSINIFEDKDTHSLQGNTHDFNQINTTTLSNDFIPLHNQDERFQQNAYINGKTKYEETNTIIKSLEDEIVTMKHKLSFVYEKDEEIGLLKKEINSLKKDNVELQSEANGVIKLRLENTQLETKLVTERSMIDKLTTENNLLKEISSNSKKITDVTDIPIEDIGEIDGIDELMDINVHTLRLVLLNRLKHKQNEHIENLITSYGLKNKNKIKKSIMEQIVEQAIHL
jgi:hypothetical protein